jgi:GNAT superfamily N-acetyltransferase
VDIRVEAHPDPDDVALLASRVTEHSQRATGLPNPVELAAFVRDPDRAIVAGVHGWTWGGCCELDHLWVDPARRGEGLATALLDAAEAEASARGCTLVVLFTHEHQAPDLYPRRGYQRVGQVTGYPAGETALWFAKPIGAVST